MSRLKYKVSSLMKNIVLIYKYIALSIKTDLKNSKKSKININFQQRLPCCPNLTPQVFIQTSLGSLHMVSVTINFFSDITNDYDLLKKSLYY